MAINIIFLCSSLQISFSVFGYLGHWVTQEIWVCQKIYGEVPERFTIQIFKESFFRFLQKLSKFSEERLSTIVWRVHMSSKIQQADIFPQGVMCLRIWLVGQTLQKAFKDHSIKKSAQREVCCCLLMFKIKGLNFIVYFSIHTTLYLYQK